MGKAKLIMAVVFLVTLGSGLVAGMLITRLGGGSAVSTPQQAPATPLARELNLTAEQNDRMRNIWEGVRTKVDDCFIHAQDAQKRRDQALLDLLSDEQKIKFARLQEQCTDTLRSLKIERDAAFKAAVEQTNRMLSDSQQQRYREILQSRLGRGAGEEGPDWLKPPAATLPVTGP